MHGRRRPRLVFGTYQSYDVLAAAACRFGLTVADEAHHLAGDPDTACAGALRGEVPSDRTLYMTATPKRFRRGEPRWDARRSGLYMTAGYTARHQGGNQGC